MSNEIPKAQPGDTVELKDKETGFYDDETQVKVVRDQNVKLGDHIGKKTNEAIVSGGLLVVGASKSKTDDTEKTGKSDLPEDFPGRDAFLAAKMNLDAVKKHDFDQDKVAGVGAATVKAVQEYLNK